MKDRFQREPVTVAGAAILFLESLLATLVATNVITLNPDQLVSINNVIVAGAGLAALVVPIYLARNRVTPVAAPRTAEGKPAQIIEQ